MSRPVGVRKAVPLRVIGGAIASVASKAKDKTGQVAVEAIKEKLKPQSMAQTGMEMQQRRAEMQQQKNQAQMSSAQDMADKAKAGASVSKGEYVHPSVQQHIQDMYNKPNLNLPDDYSGVSRQNFTNVLAGNREGGFFTENIDADKAPLDIPAQNLPPKIEPEPEPQRPQFDSNAEPSFKGRLPKEFYEGTIGHANFRLFGNYRFEKDEERQQIIDRIHSALSPYLDKDGNYKRNVPTKEFAIRTHLLDNIREAKEIPKDVLRQHGLSSADSRSRGDSIIAVVKEHPRTKKPILTTVMYRGTPFIRGGQPFTGDQFGKNNTMLIDAHGLSKNEFKEHVARRQKIDGKPMGGKNRQKNQRRKKQAAITARKDEKYKSEPMDLAWELLVKGSVELHHNEELPQEFIDDIMMLDRTHKMTPTNNGTLIEDIDPFMHRTIQLMAENYKEENPTVVEPRNQHLFY
jgi:hypothetical protein|tara:strand:+ start:5307 stop:6686 length:1380 start_codon:yes stop_codon:yes gene_type:complete